MISVVIPTYKRPELLARLLESICQQTLLPSEVIVIDDASLMDQAYRNCIDQFKSRLPTLYFQSLAVNSGAPHARNVGIRLAKNEWIALVDDDDEWLPEKLTKQCQIAQQAARTVGIIYTWTHAKGVGQQESYESKHSVRGDARCAILSSNFIMSPSVMVRKDAIVQAGLFDETLPSCQDWDMWTRIFLKGFTCEVVPEVLSIYHRHGGESIGLSSRAKLGYKLFLDRHFAAIVQHTGFLNIIKKSWLYFQVWRLSHD